jgi:hypothetical protein
LFSIDQKCDSKQNKHQTTFCYAKVREKRPARRLKVKISFVGKPEAEDTYSGLIVFNGK